MCENNLYMEYTPIGAVTAAEHPAADRAPAYGIPAEIIDGNDVVVVREAVARAVERARAGDGPDASSRRRPTATTGTAAPTRRSTARRRRSSAGSSATRSTSPAPGSRRWASRRTRSRRSTSAPTAHVEAAVDAAKNAPDADPAEAFTDVWADGSAAWRT